MPDNDYARAQAFAKWDALSLEDQAAIRAAVKLNRPDLEPLPDSSWVLLTACLMDVRQRMARREPLTSLLPADKAGEETVPF